MLKSMKQRNRIKRFKQKDCLNNQEKLILLKQKKLNSRTQKSSWKCFDRKKKLFSQLKQLNKIK